MSSTGVLEPRSAARWTPRCSGCKALRTMFAAVSLFILRSKAESNLFDSLTINKDEFLGVKDLFEKVIAKFPHYYEVKGLGDKNWREMGGKL